MYIHHNTHYTTALSCLEEECSNRATPHLRQSWAALPQSVMSHPEMSHPGMRQQLPCSASDAALL